MCISEDCKKQPTYNNEGEKKALYCSKHKLEGMVNVMKQMCNYQNCKTIPCYNNEGEIKGMYCAIHK